MADLKKCDRCGATVPVDDISDYATPWAMITLTYNHSRNYVYKSQNVEVCNVCARVIDAALKAPQQPSAAEISPEPITPPQSTEPF